MIQNYFKSIPEVLVTFEEISVHPQEKLNDGWIAELTT